MIWSRAIFRDVDWFFVESESPPYERAEDLDKE